MNKKKIQMDGTDVLILLSYNQFSYILKKKIRTKFVFEKKKSVQILILLEKKNAKCGFLKYKSGSTVTVQQQYYLSI